MDVLDQCQTVIVQLPNQSVVYDFLFGLHEFYRPIHTYVSIVLCALGAVCNFCNIVVLTRKQMRTPVNMILTAMACCDTVVLFSNLVYTTHYTFVAFSNCHPKHWSYGWAMFLIAHAHLSLVGHSSSVWLSVMLAMIRYMTLRRRGKMTGVQIGLKHSYCAIASVILFVSIMNAPNFLTYKIMELGLNETCVITDESVRYAPAYVPGVSDMAVEADCLVFRMAFWISGTVFKVLPCLLLTLLVSLLTKILDEVKENRQRLLRGSRTGSDPLSSFNIAQQQNGVSPMPSPNPGARNIPLTNGDSHKKATKNTGSSGKFGMMVTANVASPMPVNRSGSIKYGGKAGRTDRTTRMLLAIVCVFLITELPQGIMAVLSGMFSEEFRRYIYNSLGDILDLLSLCGACTSFIIYCSMSGQFRNEFRRVFIPDRMKKCWTDSSPANNPDQGIRRSFCSATETYNQTTNCSRNTIGGGGAALNTSTFLRPSTAEGCNGKGGGSSMNNFLCADTPRLIGLNTIKNRQANQRHSAADLLLPGDCLPTTRSPSPFSTTSDCGIILEAKDKSPVPYRQRASSTTTTTNNSTNGDQELQVETTLTAKNTPSSTASTSPTTDEADLEEKLKDQPEQENDLLLSADQEDSPENYSKGPNRRQVVFQDLVVSNGSDNDDCEKLLVSEDEEDSSSAEEAENNSTEGGVNCVAKIVQSDDDPTLQNKTRSRKNKKESNGSSKPAIRGWSRGSVKSAIVFKGFYIGY